MSLDPTTSLDERGLWAFASRLLAQHRACVGEVVSRLFEEHTLDPDPDALRRWLQVLDMIEQLNGPGDAGLIH